MKKSIFNTFILASSIVASTAIAAKMPGKICCKEEKKIQNQESIKPQDNECCGKNKSCCKFPQNIVSISTPDEFKYKSFIEFAKSLGFNPVDETIETKNGKKNYRCILLSRTESNENICPTFNEDYIDISISNNPEYKTIVDLIELSGVKGITKSVSTRNGKVSYRYTLKITDLNPKEINLSKILSKMVD